MPNYGARPGGGLRHVIAMFSGIYRRPGTGFDSKLVLKRHTAAVWISRGAFGAPLCTQEPIIDREVITTQRGYNLRTT